MSNVNIDKKYINIIKSTIVNTQYMTKIRKEKFRKDNGYENNLISELDSNSKKIIMDLQEYEYDKNYRYFSLYKFNDDDNNIKNKLNNSTNLFNIDGLDIISKEIKKPSLKVYDNDNFDIKFSFLVQDTIKYVVIASFFLDLEIVAIKYYSVTEDFYEEDFYININEKVKNYILNVLELNIKEFDSYKVFKKLYADIKKEKENKINLKNVSIHSIRMDDNFNGSSYFKATDQEILPFIGNLEQLVKKFESEKDKDIILNYIKKYEDDSLIRKLSIKWKHKFSNNNSAKLGNIIVGLSKVYRFDEVSEIFEFAFFQHHITQNESINKERIDYVIKYIANYIKSNDK